MKSRYATTNIIIQVLLFIFLEVISIVLITNNSIVQRYRILGSLRFVQSFVWEKESNVGQYFRLKRTNDALILENSRLKQSLADYKQYVESIDSLAIIEEGDFLFVPAEVIKNSTTGQHNYLIINKGYANGISEGAGVISSDGIVGVVSSVSEKYAYVLSFLNSSQSVSVKLNHSDSYGPMHWDGISRNQAIMTEVPLFCKATVGDTVVTSGFSAIFPEGIPVGVVQGIEKRGGLYENLSVSLFQKFNTLSNVYITLNKESDEISDLEKRGEIDE